KSLGRQIRRTYRFGAWIARGGPSNRSGAQRFARDQSGHATLRSRFPALRDALGRRPPALDLLDDRLQVATLVASLGIECPLAPEPLVGDAQELARELVHGDAPQAGPEAAPCDVGVERAAVFYRPAADQIEAGVLAVGLVEEALHQGREAQHP